MREYNGLDSVEPEANSVVSVGTFDGVHRGHQRLVERVKELAAERGGCATLVTFEPHPQLVLQKTDKPPIRILTTLEEKREIVRQLGVDRFVVLAFTDDFSRMSAREFVLEVLVKRIGCAAIVVGPDHGFGKRREGTIETLRELGGEFGFAVEVVPELVLDGREVSSTAIRKTLELEGDVRTAAEMLGRPYEVRGVVGRGAGRGRDLGFPTANLVLDTPHKLLPKDGIYAGKAVVRGETFPAAINIGVRPTFNGGHRVVEAHILGNVGNLYGTHIRIQFVERIRDEVAFRTAAELVERMKEDVEETLRILREHRRSLVEQEER